MTPLPRYAAAVVICGDCSREFERKTNIAPALLAYDLLQLQSSKLENTRACAPRGGGGAGNQPASSFSDSQNSQDDYIAGHIYLR